MIINASPLIIFGKLNRIDIIKKIYKEIEIVNKVYQETVIKGIEKNSRDAFIIKEHINKGDIKVFILNDKFGKVAKRIQNIYNMDIGESETISLALQLKKNIVIIDEIAAREAAKAFGIRPIGSLRIILEAYKSNLVDKSEINKLIAEMVNTKYRFSPRVLIEFWNLFDKSK